jgi:hypothetical protein
MKNAFSHQNRRDFLAVFMLGVLVSIISTCRGKKTKMRLPKNNTTPYHARIFRSINGTPAENIRKVIELNGGIGSLIGPDDLVIIKPNLQWWNQGAPNLAACNALVGLIMNRPAGFSGEVVIGENTHRGNEPWTKTGWATPFSINSDLPGVGNYNDLCNLLKKKYGNRFSVSHWIDVAAGGKRVYGPQDGPGYVYCDGTGGLPLLNIDNGLKGLDRREVIMSYPVFTTDIGTVVDFRNGVWGDGVYTGRPVKFINLAALNHHSTYCGMTSCVKNYFGIADLSNGADPGNGGKLTGDYFNFHAFAFNEWAKGPAPGMLGKEIGFFMQNVRKADLNIITAEWVGMTSRTEMPIAHTRAVLAGIDPVALDYHAAKYILYPNSRCGRHDPDWENGPLSQYLLNCAEAAGYQINENGVKVTSYDFAGKRLQNVKNMTVYGNINWGNDLKALAKYFLFRFENGILS